MSKGWTIQFIELLEEAEIYVRGFKCSATPPRTKEQASRLLKEISNVKKRYQEEFSSQLIEILGKEGV